MSGAPALVQPERPRQAVRARAVVRGLGGCPPSRAGPRAVATLVRSRVSSAMTSRWLKVSQSLSTLLFQWSRR